MLVGFVNVYLDVLISESIGKYVACIVFQSLCFGCSCLLFSASQSCCKLNQKSECDIVYNKCWGIFCLFFLFQWVASQGVNHKISFMSAWEGLKFQTHLTSTHRSKLRLETSEVQFIVCCDNSCGSVHYSCLEVLKAVTLSIKSVRIYQISYMHFLRTEGLPHALSALFYEAHKTSLCVLLKTNYFLSTVLPFA